MAKKKCDLTNIYRHCPNLTYNFLKLIPIQPPLSTHLHSTHIHKTTGTHSYTHTQLHRETIKHKIWNLEMESSAKIYFLFPYWFLPLFSTQLPMNFLPPSLPPLSSPFLERGEDRRGQVWLKSKQSSQPSQLGFNRFQLKRGGY